MRPRNPDLRPTCGGDFDACEGYSRSPTASVSSHRHSLISRHHIKVTLWALPPGFLPWCLGRIGAGRRSRISQKGNRLIAKCTLESGFLGVLSGFLRGNQAQGGHQPGIGEHCQRPQVLIGHLGGTYCLRGSQEHRHHAIAACQTDHRARPTVNNHGETVNKGSDKPGPDRSNKSQPRSIAQRAQLRRGFDKLTRKLPSREFPWIRLAGALGYRFRDSGRHCGGELVGGRQFRPQFASPTSRATSHSVRRNGSDPLRIGGNRLGQCSGFRRETGSTT